MTDPYSSEQESAEVIRHDTRSFLEQSLDNELQARGDGEQGVETAVILRQVALDMIAWREAVIDELVVDHIYNKEHESDPRKAIKDIINWNVGVALDPQVSSSAQDLIDLGSKATAEKLVSALAECRDAFPVPEHNGYAEAEWAAAISGPEHVPVYVRKMAQLLDGKAKS